MNLLNIQQIFELIKHLSDIFKPINFAISQYKAETLTLQFLNCYLKSHLTNKVSRTKKVKLKKKEIKISLVKKIK